MTRLIKIQNVLCLSNFIHDSLDSSPNGKREPFSVKNHNYRLKLIRIWKPRNNMTWHNLYLVNKTSKNPIKLVFDTYSVSLGQFSTIINLILNYYFSKYVFWEFISFETWWVVSLKQKTEIIRNNCISAQFMEYSSFICISDKVPTLELRFIIICCPNLKIRT